MSTTSSIFDSSSNLDGLKTLDTSKKQDSSSNLSISSFNSQLKAEPSRLAELSEEAERPLSKQEIKEIAKNHQHRVIQRQVIYVIGIIPEIADQKVTRRLTAAARFQGLLRPVRPNQADFRVEDALPLEAD